MRKIIIWITVVTLIVSIVGTGLLVYFDTTTPLPGSENSITSGENAQ